MCLVIVASPTAGKFKAKLGRASIGEMFAKWSGASTKASRKKLNLKKNLKRMNARTTVAVATQASMFKSVSGRR
ncbi:MAG: hypothetical protein ACI9RO_000327 [Alteromonas macleodii]|jgi:hypothetical protein